MGEQENCMPMARASKKRAFGTATSSTPNLSLQDNLPKKRVVLADLTNASNVVAATRNIGSQKPKITPQGEKTGEKREEETAKREIYVKSRYDNSQKHADAPLIYSHLRSLEAEENRRAAPNYMEKVQIDISPAMREVLVDWLVEVAEEYKLVPDTLYLTVNYVDRFLSSHALSRSSLQLLGVSSMLVASKFEEISPPHVEDFCYMTDNTYTKEEVMKMELDLLKFLNYEMGNPTTRTFIRIFTKAAQDSPTFSNLQFEFLAGYIAELSLIDYSCVRFLPSMIAASAIFLARIIILPCAHPWTLALQQFTGYASHELMECVLTIHHLLSDRRETSGRALREKYMEHKFKSVAALSPPSKIPYHYFM